MECVWFLIVPLCDDLKSLRLVNKSLKKAVDPLLFRKATVDIEFSAILKYKEYIRDLTLVIQKNTELDAVEFLKDMQLNSFHLNGKNYPKKKTIRIPKKLAHKIGLMLYDKSLDNMSCVFNNLLCWMQDVKIHHVNLYNWTKDVLAVKNHSSLCSMSLHNLDCFSHFEELPNITHLELLNFKASSRTLKPMARTFAEVDSLVIKVPNSIHVRDYDFACFPKLKNLTCYHCSAYPIPETLDYIDFYGILYCQIKYFLAKKLKGLQLLVKVNNVNELFDVKVEPMIVFLKQVKQLEYFSLGFQMENGLMYISDAPHLFKPFLEELEMDCYIKCQSKYSLATKFDSNLSSQTFSNLGAIFSGLLKDAQMITQETVTDFLKPFDMNIKSNPDTLNGEIALFGDNPLNIYMDQEE
eukprot:NODE_121_length_18880_cov_0.205687.p3 type:complete len:410 gc:universal NODE_121_length_18880_cov_0.205687:12599-13828(+)